VARFETKVVPTVKTQEKSCQAQFTNGSTFSETESVAFYFSTWIRISSEATYSLYIFNANANQRELRARISLAYISNHVAVLVKAAWS